MPDRIESLLQEKVAQLEVEVLLLDELFQMQKLTVDPGTLRQQLGLQKEWAMLSLRAAKNAQAHYLEEKNTYVSQGESHESG